MRRGTVAGVVGALLAVIVLGGCRENGGSPRPGPEQRLTRDERIRKAFGDFADGAAEKPGASVSPSDYVLVGTDRAPDGAAVSLWASADPAGPSLCFWLDVEREGGFAQGAGGCGAPGGYEVSLSGDTSLSVGRLGEWRAVSVQVSAAGLDPVTVPVVSRCFLVPARFTYERDVPLTLTLLDAGGKVVAVAKDVPAVGTVLPKAP
ncbi:hypothetical protein [Catellatospora citrea]|uniref:Lipoprotein n=1 Tax=Catellatospora citrea TaxID=53366 RepID=A0A8J3P2M6_9ACTN|nr:hypothetical protein [Catellatospora citrea]RKE08587.1 hypothetical protein C8E86_3439 [Catellatospora citrea]GIG01684.1 hypothetical protein Cci01nite_67770 [Catellatospora citrea]